MSFSRTKLIVHGSLLGHIVYGLIDPRTNLVRYVGLTSCGYNRFKSHWQNKQDEYQGNPHKGNWVNQLREVSTLFEVCVLDRAESLDELKTKEMWWIAYGRALGWPLTNISDGGDRPVLSEAARKVISDKLKAHYATRGEEQAAKNRGRVSAMRGRKHTPETLEKMSKSQAGKVKSKEHRMKIAASNRGKQRSAETLENMAAAQRGRKHTPETREKMAAAQRGRKQSPELVARRAASQRGKTVSAETRAKISASKQGKKQTPEAVARRAAAVRVTNAAKRAARSFIKQEENRLYLDTSLEASPETRPDDQNFTGD